MKPVKTSIQWIGPLKKYELKRRKSSWKRGMKKVDKEEKESWDKSEAIIIQSWVSKWKTSKLLIIMLKCKWKLKTKKWTVNNVAINVAIENNKESIVEKDNKDSKSIE